MSNDYVNPHKAPDLLENYGIPSDPQERKRFEAEKRAAFQQNVNQAQQSAPQAVQQYDQSLTQGSEIVFLVNNKARPIHIPDEQIVIDGQLSVSARGPFLQISKEKLNSSYQLQTHMSTPASKSNPILKNVPAVEELSEAEFKKRFAEYNRKKVLREAEYAKEHNNVARHEDGSIDEDDAMFEIRKVNTNIIRAQG